MVAHNTDLIDDIDLPFADDVGVLGKWISVAWIQDWVDGFVPSPQADGDLYYRSVEFLPNGLLHADMRDNFITAGWTKGFKLMDIGNGNTACAYEIRLFDGKEYLFAEWKSGDYTHRRMKPGYYIFIRCAS